MSDSTLAKAKQTRLCGGGIVAQTDVNLQLFGFPDGVDQQAVSPQAVLDRCL